MLRYWNSPKYLPRLQTERLLLRPMERSDFVDLYDYARREDTSRYLVWTPHPSPDYTRNYLAMIARLYRKGQFFDWAIVERQSGRMIGTCGFTKLDLQNRVGEIGYVLNPTRHGRGYATEAVMRVLEYGFFELQLNRVEGRYMVENMPSRRVMERCGLTYEGVLRQSMLIKGVYRDIGICSIVREEYLQFRQRMAAQAMTVR